MKAFTLLFLLVTSFHAAKAETPDSCASSVLAAQAGAYWNFSYMDDASGTLKPLFQSGAFEKYSTCGNKLAVTAGAYINIYLVESTGKSKHLLQSGAFEHLFFLPNGWFAVSAGAYHNLYNSKGEYVAQYYQGSLPFDAKSGKWFKPFAKQ